METKKDKRETANTSGKANVSKAHVSKTHWKKLCNPDYLGAYALEPGRDIVLTIDYVCREMVAGADGKKEECTVMHFAEAVKPMIVNATNAKMITKLLQSPFIEDWQGKRIQLYAAVVKAFGENVEALRVRPFLPKIDATKPIKCAKCKNDLKPEGKMSVSGLAEYTQKKYGMVLCADCAKAESELRKTSDAGVL